MLLIANQEVKLLTIAIRKERLTEINAYGSVLYDLYAKAESKSNHESIAPFPVLRQGALHVVMMMFEVWLYNSIAEGGAVESLNTFFDV